MGSFLPFPPVPPRSCELTSLFPPIQLGSERFWPTTNDGPEEIAKCERILRQFTVEGVGFKITAKNPRTGKKSTKKVMRKIPAKVCFTFPSPLTLTPPS